MVLICELVSFSIAFSVLLFFIRIREIEHTDKKNREPFLKNCLDVFGFQALCAVLPDDNDPVSG